MEQDKERDIASLSFEDALEELTSIVQRLERGEAKLEDSIALYQRGTALKAHCEGKLRAAQAKIEKITLSADGGPDGTEAFEESKS